MEEQNRRWMVKSPNKLNLSDRAMQPRYGPILGPRSFQPASKHPHSRAEKKILRSKPGERNGLQQLAVPEPASGTVGCNPLIDRTIIMIRVVPIQFRRLMT